MRAPGCGTGKCETKKCATNARMKEARLEIAAGLKCSGENAINEINEGAKK